MARCIDLFTNPVDWRQLIQGFKSQLIELEIGSGKGLFLRTAATEYPETQFVGIELAAKFAKLAAERAEKVGLDNVTVLRGDAKQVMQSIIPDASIARIHVYFPDPWWRNKHKKRRVLNDQTIADIYRALAAGGELIFWTDVLDYYEHICQQLMEETQFLGPRYVPEPPVEHSMDYTTHFERRARLNSQPVYRALFVKPL